MPTSSAYAPGIAAGTDIQARDADGEGLPLDLRTTLVGIRRRVPLAVAIAILGTLAGIGAGFLFGDRVYQTTTVLLYRPPQGASADSEGNEAPSLRTQVDLVKIPSNLEEARRRLRLSTDIVTMGRAFEVEVPENTSLLTVRATWDDADTTAALANTLRDVFLENQRGIARSEAQSKMRDLEDRLSHVVEQQAQADTALKEYSTDHGVVDLDKEAQWYLEQLISTELIYEQAVGEKQAVELQQANLNKVVAELKDKVASEEQSLESLSSGKSESDNQELRGRLAIVDLKQRELERAEQLREQGLISRSQEDQMRAALEAERYAVFNNSPTAGLLKEMLVRELNIKLDAISADRKVSQLGEAVARVKDKLKQLPVVQREYIMLKREVDAREAERSRIEQILAGERRKAESQTFGFNVVSEAKVPLVPLRSNRRLMALAVSAAGVVAGLVLIVVLELTNPRVRSAADVAIKLQAPCLAAIPAYGAKGDADASELFVGLYQSLRRRWPASGFAVLVTSAGPGGRSRAVAMELAKAASDHQERVLVIDAETRSVDALPARDDIEPPVPAGRLAAAVALLRRWWPEHTAALPAAAFGCACLAEPRKGLRDFVDGREKDWHSLQVTHADCGVASIAKGGRLTSAQLASDRMANLLEEARKAYSVVIVHATAVLPLPDAGFLSEHVDGTLLEVSSASVRSDLARRALQRLAEGPAATAGVVLTDIDPAYMES